MGTSVIVCMEIEARKVINCDHCKVRLLPEENIDDLHMEATMMNSQGVKQQYHFCDRECLRGYLNANNYAKNQKKKKSKASIIYNIRTNILEVELPVN